ncbi:MAG TPA: DUF3224 domain-containing protein [Propionibacteriaceae bacterium]
MSQQHAEGTFVVVSFAPVDVTPSVEVATAMASGLATMEKRYTGEIEGVSSTLFTYTRSATSESGTYVAVEAFAGLVNGASGGFNFLHAASTHGEDRYGEFFTIVDDSGTDGLAGITGAGGMAVDADGTHRIWFDYLLP